MKDPLTIAKSGLEWIAAGVHNPQFVAQTTLGEIGRTGATNEVINAAQKLANEVAGMLGSNEVAYRQLMGKHQLRSTEGKTRRIQSPVS